MRFRLAGTTAIAVIVAAAFGRSAAADSFIKVIGTGNAAADVANVQAALDTVDPDGEVRLIGTFNFDAPPTVPYERMVTITRALTLSGPRELATLDCGSTPGRGVDALVIAAPGANVTIRRLRIVSPENAAITVVANIPPFQGGTPTPGGVGNLSITDCVFEGVRPFRPPAFAFGVATGISIDPPLPAFIGAPPPFAQVGANFTGNVTIRDNEIDVGGTSSVTSFGVFVGPLGADGANLELDISGNRIANTTNQAIHVGPAIRGEARILRNEIETGNSRFGNVAALQAIACLGVNTRAGTFTVALNRIDCGSDNGQGIFVVAADGALLTTNRVTMETSGPTSGGIVLGGCLNTVALANKVEGTARAAVAVVQAVTPVGTFTPSNCTLVANNFRHFAATLADIEVGAGADGTTVLGGAGTISIAPTATNTTVWGRFEILP